MPPTWNTSRDEDQISTRKRLLHAIVVWEVTIDLRHGRDVGQVCRNTWSVDDIVEGEVVDLLARLEEE